MKRPTVVWIFSFFIVANIIYTFLSIILRYFIHPGANVTSGFYTINYYSLIPLLPLAIFTYYFFMLRKKALLWLYISFGLLIFIHLSAKDWIMAIITIFFGMAIWDYIAHKKIGGQLLFYDGRFSVQESPSDYHQERGNYMGFFNRSAQPANHNTTSHSWYFILAIIFAVWSFCHYFLSSVWAAPYVPSLIITIQYILNWPIVVAWFILNLILTVKFLQRERHYSILPVYYTVSFIILLLYNFFKLLIVMKLFLFGELSPTALLPFYVSASVIIILKIFEISYAAYMLKPRIEQPPITNNFP